MNFLFHLLVLVPFVHPSSTTNVSCAFDSCIEIASIKSRNLWATEKVKCQCDNLCEEYGDCCSDASRYSPLKTKAARGKWTCTEVDAYGHGYYMKDSCPDDYENAEIISNCKIDVNDNSDPVATSIVTSLNSQFTYKNYYCATCHKDAENLIIWPNFVTCVSLNKSIEKGEIPPGNLEEDYKLEYNGLINVWGVNVTSARGPIFHECKLDAAIPETVSDLVRKCEVLIDECSPDWEDVVVQELCESYTSTVYVSDTAYRNIHCLMCNRFDPQEATCLPSIRARQNWRDTYGPMSVLFDVNEKTGNAVGKLKMCEHDEIWDPFFQKCRALVCGRPGFVLRRGRCVDVSSSDKPVPETTVRIPDSTTAERETTTELTTTTMSPVSTTELPPSSTVDSTSTVSSTGESSSPDVVTTTETSPETSSVTAVQSTTDFSETAVFESTTETETPFVSESTEGNLSKEAEKLFEKEAGIGNVSAEEEETTYNYFDDVSNATTSTTTEETALFSDEFIACPKIVINGSDFEFKPDRKIFIPRYGKELEFGRYDITEGNHLLLCIDDIEGLGLINKFPAAMSYVSTIFLGISMICIVAHMISYAVLRDCRNLSGNCLASLCVSLFTAYLTFIVGSAGLFPTACVVVGVVTYYSFLAAFFWMSVMAFDVWKTLRLATKQLQQVRGMKWKKFACYSAYAWLVPGAVVSAAVVCDNVPSVPSELKPNFGLNNCWFGSKKPLVVFFVAPLAAVLVINVVFFVLSAHTLVSTTWSTMMKTNGQTGRRNYFLYLKLALIMGLSWTVGLVAGFADVEPLWYIFIILNSLQGLFIFVAFTCTKKMLGGVFQRVCIPRDIRRRFTLSTTLQSRKNDLEPKHSGSSDTSNTSSKTVLTGVSSDNSAKTPVQTPEIKDSRIILPRISNGSISSMETLY